MTSNTVKYHELRSKWISEMGGKCVKCGSTSKLEFDHINPKEKLYNIAKIWHQHGKVTLELKKCQLLCNVCHLEKTKSEFPKVERVPAHGKISEYFRHKCRCEECRKCYSVWKKEYRRKKAIADGIPHGVRLPYRRESKHGEELSYTRGCRCDLCRKGHAEYALKMKRKKRQS